MMSCFFCMNGMQKYCMERARCFCNKQLKISGRFLIKFLFLVLNFAKVTIFRCFSFSLMFRSIIHFQYRKNKYVFVN